MKIELTQKRPKEIYNNDNQVMTFQYVCVFISVEWVRAPAGGGGFELYLFQISSSLKSEDLVRK